MTLPNTCFSTQHGFIGHRCAMPLTIYRYVPNGSSIFPLLLSHVSAGFPSPADDHLEQMLDLNELMVKHPAATFFVRVEGDSMINAGIRSGDILVVDRAVPCQGNSVIVAMLNGEFTVKRVKVDSDGLYLMPENEQYSPIKITSEMDFELWGVVTFTIHKVV